MVCGEARPNFARSACAFVLLLVTACSSGATFRRPTPSSAQTIRDEATGTTYTDCRAAFAAATADTVLTFSEGVFRCGPELAIAADWLVLRGAGLGRTFLDAGDGQLTALRPGRFLHLEDLAFGGFSAMTGEESRAELVRVAVASERPALFGSLDRGVAGTILVSHSVLSSHVGPRLPGDLLPRPLAFNGNERIAVVESVLLDIEQEYERFPAPGSVVLLSEGVQTAFELHEPAQKQRRDASFRPNVTCGNARNPRVFCAGQEVRAEDDFVVDAARRVRDGSALAALEEPLRLAARGFSDRFRTALGPAIRQPDVFWFDDLGAKVIEDEAAFAGGAALTSLVQPHAAEIIEECGQPEAAMRVVLERARAVDRLLLEPFAAVACSQRLSARVEAIVRGCGEGWKWEQLLAAAADADAALGSGGASVESCREKLRGRLGALADRGGLTAVYLREVNRVLGLDGVAGAAAGRASLDGLALSLPWIILKSGRSIPASEPPTIADLLIRTNQLPNAGDGRKLLEITGPCQLAPASPGSQQLKAVGRATLAEELPNRSPTDEARLVVELPVEAGKEDIDASTPSGGVNVALVKKCDELAAAAYPAAVKRYVVDELKRLALAGSVKSRTDAEVALLLALGAADGKELTHEPRNVPVVRAALAAVQEDLLRGGAAFAVTAVPIRTDPGSVAAAAVAASATKAPPTWAMTDFARAVDVLSRAGIVDVDACAFLLPQIPWKQGEGFLSGAIVLETVPATVRCRPDTRGFELSLWVSEAPPLRVKILAALERTLIARLGAPTAQSTAMGPASAWPATPRARTGFVFKSVPPANSMLGYVLVPLGSNWTHR